MAADIFPLNSKMVCIFLLMAIFVTRSDGPSFIEHGFFLTKSLKSYDLIRSRTEKRRLPPDCRLKNASKNETECAIEAINRAKIFFRQNGHEIITPISIEFVKEVKVDLINAGQSDCKKNLIPALYNAGTKCIKIVEFDSDYFKRRAIMGAFHVDKEFYISIITHEVTHRLYDSIIGKQVETIYHPYSEFIAYVTQIGTLKKNYRNRVLSLCPKEKFPSVCAINSFMWTADPNKFALMSYRFYESEPRFFQDILENKIKPMELGFIFEY